MFLPSAVFAQDYAPVEVFGGLSVMRVGQMDDKDGRLVLSSGGMSGWGASVAFNLNPSWAVKADFSGQYTGIEGLKNVNLGRHNILGGVQYNMRYSSFNVFFEGLAGLTSYGLNGDNVRDNANFKGLGIAGGGGVDWKFSDRFSWRVAQMNYTFAKVGNRDYPGNPIEGAKAGGFRFQTGILINLGN